MKIVLVALYDIRSYAIRILHSILKQNGFDVISIFFNESMDSKYYSQKDVDLLVKSINEQGPDIIGFSVRSPCFQLFKKISKKIKSTNDCLLIAGGHHATIAPQEVIEYADVVCIGEGEQPLLELSRKFFHGESFHSVKNLWIKSGNKVIKNHVRPLIQDLDRVPFPDHSPENKLIISNGKLIEDNSYYFEKSASMSVITTRGCFFNCSFCYNATLKNIYKHDKKYVRRRSVDNVIQEIFSLKVQNPNLEYIFFSDNVFTYNKNWLLEFSKLYKKYINLPFGCFSHFTMLDEKSIISLKEAGLRDITLGIQSGSEEICKKVFNRHVSIEKIVKGSEMLSRCGLTIYYDLITNNPCETHTTHLETMNLLLRLKKPFRLRVFKMKFYPMVPLTIDFLEKGLISQEQIESVSELSFSKWKDPIDTCKDKHPRELFWDSIYFMIQKNFPKMLILMFSKLDVLKKHPKIIAVPLKYGFQKRLIQQDILMALKGDYKGLFYRMKNKIPKRKGWGY